MRILVDTNILLRTIEPAHEQHPQATHATDVLRRHGNILCLVPQNIYEFWVVATRPREVNGVGMAPAEANRAVSDFLHLFTLLRDERAIFEEWRDIVVDNQVCGVKAHDARLAAAMFRHGIERILTFNIVDFRRFDHVQVLDPETVIAASSGS